MKHPPPLHITTTLSPHVSIALPIRRRSRAKGRGVSEASERRLHAHRQAMQVGLRFCHREGMTVGEAVRANPRRGPWQDDRQPDGQRNDQC